MDSLDLIPVSTYLGDFLQFCNVYELNFPAVNGNNFF